jgi:hypothetical protein
MMQQERPIAAEPQKVVAARNECTLYYRYARLGELQLDISERLGIGTDARYYPSRAQVRLVLMQRNSIISLLRQCHYRRN